MGNRFANKYRKSYKIWPGLFILASFVFIIILSPTSVAASVDVTLDWNASSGADGYRLFYREEGQNYTYNSPDWEGSGTTHTIYSLDDATTYHFVVRAYNAYGESGDSIEAHLYPIGPNQPPVLASIGPKSINEGSQLTFTVTATDPDGDGLTFSASNVPSGASFNPSTRVFSWTPGYGDTGNYNVTFTVTDDGSPAESDSETVTISVGDVNRPPVLGAIGSKVVDEGQLLSFTVTATDPDGDGLTFSASNVPSGASFNPSTRVFSWTPAIGATGSYNVTFTVTDDGSPAESDSETVTITVGDNLALGKSVTGGSSDWGALFSYIVDGLWDETSLGWSADAVPNWVEIDLENDYQVNRIIVGPYMRSSDTSWNYNDAWNIQYKSSTDTEWQDFASVNKLSGGGTLQGTGISITNGDPGHHNSDDSYKHYSFTFAPVTARYIRYEVTVGDSDNDVNGNEIEVYGNDAPVVNRPPVLGAIGSKSVNEGQLLSFTVTATDPDGDGLTFSASNLPSGASFNSSTRRFSWTPGYGATGNYNVTFTVIDNGSPAQSDSETVTISVGNVNRPPVLGAIGSKSVDEGQVLSFTVTATDPDGDGLTFSASNLPSGASFNSSTRRFSWTPGYGATGNYNVTFTVIDNGSPAQSDSETVTISVGNVNRPPVLGAIGSKSVDEGQVLSFTVTATDPDGDGLTFSASNLPSGASFNSSTRRFSWTPAFGDAGNYNVQFTVTDNGSPPQSDFEIVAITVINPAASNLPPDQPVITSPYYGEMESDLLLTAETEAFSDPDVGDFHSKSRWQIVHEADFLAGDFSKAVLDITNIRNLTAMTVPHSVLDRDATYYVLVQFYDGHDEPSEWSEAVKFSTNSSIVDLDGNGIPDAHEVDDTVDLNGDGIPDNDQPDVIKSILSAIGANEPFGVNKISASIDAIEVLEPINPSTILDKRNKPATFLFGLASYRLRLSQIGATVLVRIYYSEDISSASRYFLYDTVYGWHDYTQYTTFNPDGRSVTVELKDGGHGDSDGVANGVIVDPGGVVGAATFGADSGAGGGCFIATAAFDSYVEPYVKLQAESYREKHDRLKPIVRVLLMPLAGVRYILVRSSLATMILVGLLLTISVISFYTIVYRRRKY